MTANVTYHHVDTFFLRVSKSCFPITLEAWVRGEYVSSRQFTTVETALMVAARMVKKDGAVAVNVYVEDFGLVASVEK